MFKNVANQKIAFFAWDTANDTEKTGDATNISVQISKDGGTTAASTNSVSELDSTDAPGVYILNLTQAETNCDLFIAFAKSSTSNVKIEPVIAYTIPQVADVNVTKWNGTVVDVGSSSNLPKVDAQAISNSTTAADDVEANISNLNATVSSRSSHSASDVWSVETRALTDKAGFSLAADQSGVTIGTVNDLGATAESDVRSKVDEALNAAIPDNPTVNSINERIKAIDDKLPTNDIADQSDLAAVKTKTDKLNFNSDATPLVLADVRDVADDAVAGVNDFKADVSGLALEANVEGHVTDALNSYDPPTKAEMDAGFTGLNDPTAGEVADAVWDEAIADHTGVGTFGAKNQKAVPSESADDYKADVSGLSTFDPASDTVNVGKVKGTTLGNKVGDNFNTFFQNAGNDTTKIVDNVGAGEGGAGGMPRLE